MTLNTKTILAQARKNADGGRIYQESKIFCVNPVTTVLDTNGMCLKVFFFFLI
jgi:hypothetical protein